MTYPDCRGECLFSFPKLSKFPFRSIRNIPDSRYSLPERNLPQGKSPSVPIVPSSRTICVVRPGVCIGGCPPAVAIQQPGANRTRVAGLGEVYGQRPLCPATVG